MVIRSIPWYAVRRRLHIVKMEQSSGIHVHQTEQLEHIMYISAVSYQCSERCIKVHTTP